MSRRNPGSSYDAKTQSSDDEQSRSNRRRRRQSDDENPNSLTSLLQAGFEAETVEESRQARRAVSPSDMTTLASSTSPSSESSQHQNGDESQSSTHQDTRANTTNPNQSYMSHILEAVNATLELTQDFESEGLFGPLPPVLPNPRAKRRRWDDDMNDKHRRQ